MVRVGSLGRLSHERYCEARLRVVRQGLSVLIFSVTLLAFLIIVVVPIAVGAQNFTVLTQSMEPAYPPGTLIVVKPVSMSELRIGDVVTYQVASGEPEVVTHRVVGFGAAKDGQRTLVTQGDANNTVDDSMVFPAQVHGKLIYSVPWVGYVSHALGAAQASVSGGLMAGKSVVIILMVAGLLAYGAVMLFRGIRERKEIWLSKERTR